MIQPTPNSSSKSLALIGALCAATGWFLLVVFCITFLAVLIAVLFGWLSMSLNIGKTGRDIVFGWFALFILSGVGYVGIALSLHCPHCDHKFLRNPKGLGPAGFIYHPGLPRRRGFNPWAIQVVRFLKTRKISCINCGEEIFP